MKTILFTILLIGIKICSAQSNEKLNYIILDSTKLNNSKSKTLKSFRLANSKNGELKDGVYTIYKQKGSYFLRLESSRKKISYQTIPPIATPTGVDCTTQEREQWENYRTSIYPIKLAEANRTCKIQYFCLVIYCNGQATVAYFIAILPTNRRCPQEVPYTKSQTLND